MIGTSLWAIEVAAIFSPFFKQISFRLSAVVIVKAIGLLGKVTLTRLAGPEGIGLYQMAYSFYGVALMLASGGLPTALALYTAKSHTSSRTWLKLLSVYLLIAGGAVSLLTYQYSGVIADLMGNSQLELFIRCLAPAVLIVPLLSLLRGYMQGLEKYNVIAVSEVIEQTVRISTMVIIAYALFESSLQAAVGYGMLSASFGAAAAFLFLACFSYLNISKNSLSPPPRYYDLTWFLHSSLLISLTRLLVPFSDMVDAFIIPHRLQAAGYSAAEAVSIFGVLTGMAVLIVYIPTVASAALSYTITMKLVMDWRNRKFSQYARNTGLALEACWAWGAASSLFLFTYASQISWLLFGSDTAADPVHYLAIVPLFVGLREISTSALWAQERKKTPFIGQLAALCAGTVAYYFLVAIPGMAYRGAAFSIILIEFIATAWNLLALQASLRTLNLFRLTKDAIVPLILICALKWAFSMVIGSVPFAVYAEMTLFMALSVCYILFRFAPFIKSYRLR